MSDPPDEIRRQRRVSKIAGVERHLTTMLPFLCGLIIANLAVSVLTLAAVAALLWGRG